MTHPDLNPGLLDQPLYGPRDPAIADRVQESAQAGPRLAEIDTLILEARVSRLIELGAGRAAGS